MSRSCPHAVVGGQCMLCLADHLAVEAAMLAQIRTARRLPPDPAQTPPRHPCYQWELKPTGFAEGYKNLIPEKTIFTPC